MRQGLPAAETDLVDAIAHEVGVSHSTVRRCLSGAEARYGATARRMADIRAVAERLGYVPNSAARALRKGRFDCVALLGSYDRRHGYLPDALMSGIHDRLADHRVRLSMARAEDEVLADCSRLKPLLQRIGADGLLLDYIDHVPEGMAGNLAAMRLPAVWINRDVAHDAVRVDDEAGASLVTDALVRRGRRCIAYVDFSHDRDDPTAHYSARERHDGWQRMARRSGAEGPCFHALVPASERLDAARRWLRGLQRTPDAIMGYTAEHAAIVMSAAQLEGLPTPAIADLGAVDNEPWLLGAAYTCAQLPFAAIAAAAVTLLLDKVAGADGPQPAIVIPPTLCIPAA
jgi:LacI family transcriptional regulator